MMNKTISFAILASFFVLGSCGSGGEGTKNPNWDTEPSLYTEYDSTFLIGNIISPGDLGGVRFDILKYHFNTATAENHMKPDYIAPSSSGGGYRYDDADKIVAAAKDAGLKMHGHTLIWHDQTPGWLTSGDAATVTNNLKKYVTDVVDHFKGKVISWDVVNEAINQPENLSADLEKVGWESYDWTECLRDSPWNKAGVDKAETTYIEAAFRAARAADPNATLFYNDFYLNSVRKSRATYLMVKDINDRNSVGGRKLIEGIGMQSHHHLNTDPATVDTAIKLFASLGVEIAISEMDIAAANGGAVNDSRLGSWNESASKKQAEVYAKMFKVFKDNKQYITRVTFWGINDGAGNWRKENHAFLFDENFGLKPAFFAVQNPSQFITP